ncbi:hypothetical protein ACVFYP_14250 [Roseomonas sp. F4]
MSATFRRALTSEAGSDTPPTPEAAEGRLAWLIGLGALVGLCLAVALVLPGADPAPEPPGAAQALSLLAPRAPEPATLGGMNRALVVLDRDLTIWQRLVAPEGRIDLGPLRAGLADFTGFGHEAPPRPTTDEPAANPAVLALTLLAMTLAGATLCVGITALLLDQRLRATFRADRVAACDMAEGQQDRAAPATERIDEADHIGRIAAEASARALEPGLASSAVRLREDLARQARDMARQVQARHAGADPSTQGLEAEAAGTGRAFESSQAG